MKISQSKAKKLQGKGLKIAVILSRFNDDIGNELLKNTETTLLKNGVATQNIKVVRVPGALEIPFAAQIVAKRKKYDAIIALGVVIKGATPHFEYVSQECYRGLMEVSLKNEVPIIFGVLTVLNEKQARERTSKNRMNKGEEYALAALEMARFSRNLK
jgi:6,7-dimethyl-8-ribityllumazine synthase